MQERIRNAIARIDVVQQGRSISRGTGCLVANGIVLTALHVVADRTQPSLAPYPGEIVLTFPSGSMKAAIHGDCWDRLADWALLRFDHPAAGNGSLRPVPIAELRDDGMAWETFGFPDANPRDGMANVGEVSNRAGTLEGNPVFQLFSREAAAGQGAPVKGLSGSPVIVQNAVVGVLRFALMKDSQTVAGTLYACPIASVLEKTGNLLPLPDPCIGLPGLPRQPLPAEPFRNLAWFTAKEAEVFFGRNREIRQLYGRLTMDDAPPILLLYGQTGVGKSSILDAGVVPRLRWHHQVCYLRRDAHLTLLQTLRASLDLMGGQEAEDARDLAGAWHAVEQNGGKPLVVFLDQVEETFTHPNPEFPREWEEFAREVGALFAETAAPRGKLVLSFRKEWLSDIQKQMEFNHLAHTKVFLEGLDRASVVEAITGITQTERLRQFYGLSIAPGLPEQIAAELLADPDSPIAPTLQILLTKMWAKATETSRNAPRLTAELYSALKKEGLLLGDFLDQQLEALRTAHSEWVQSGLALDVLACHTTSSLTTKECSLDSLLDTYKHRAADIAPLVQSLQDLFLLSDSSPDDARKATRLCHDTMATLVRQRYARSENPGQIARRILESRVDDWKETSEAGLLDEGSLKMVESGAAGMRLLTGKERKLVAASRALQARRERGRRWVQIGAAAAVLIIIATAVFASLETRKYVQERGRATAALNTANQRKNEADHATADAEKATKTAADVTAEAARQKADAEHRQLIAGWQLALSDGVRLIDTEPARALVAAVAAVGMSRKLGDVDVQTRSVLLRSIESAREQYSLQTVTSTAMDWAPDGTFAVMGQDLPQHLNYGVYLYDPTGHQQPRIPAELIPEMDPNGRLKFSPDGKYVAVVGRQLRVFDRQGKAVNAIPRQNDVNAVAFLPDANDPVLLAAINRGPIQAWHMDGKPYWPNGGPDFHNALTIAARKPTAASKRFLVVAAGALLEIWGDDPKRVAEAVNLGPASSRVMNVDIATAPDGKSIVAAATGTWTATLNTRRDNAVHILPEGAAQLILPFPNLAICQVKFSPQGDLLAVALDDGSVRFVDPFAGIEVYPPFRTTSQSCSSLAFDATGGRLAINATPTVHVLDMANGPIARTFHSGMTGGTQFDPAGKEIPLGTGAIAFSRDGLYVAAARGQPGMTWWNTQTGEQHSWMKPPPYVVSDFSPALAFSPDGKHLATSNSDHFLRVWNTATGQMEQSHLFGNAFNMGFDRAAKKLWIATGTGVDEMDVATGEERHFQQIPPGPMQAMVLAAFSPDGDRLATLQKQPQGYRVQLWNADGTPTGRIFRTGSVTPTAGVSFTADGQALVIPSGRSITYWGLKGEKLLPYTDTNESVGIPAASADRMTVVRPGPGLEVFDGRTDSKLAEFRTAEIGFDAAAVTANGARAATLQSDGSVRLWRTDWHEWLRIACNRIKNHPVLQEQTKNPFELNNLQFARETCQEMVWSKAK